MRPFVCLVSLVCLLFANAGALFAQANGKLQIHYLDVGQGDAAVLISPGGEVVLFDNGVLRQCGKPIGYLQSLGITRIDYHIASHYHSDHIGCTAEVLGMFPLQNTAFDRGGSYTTQTFTTYVKAVGAKRVTATMGQTITLDRGSPQPVAIQFIAANANGVPTQDENDRSLVARVRFGQFEAEFGGDLSGATTGVVDPDPNEAPPPVPPPPPPLPPPPSPTPPGGSDTCARPPDAPANATAVCNDGWFSSSQNRQGTCSSHGGVRCWICPGPLCNGLSAAPQSITASAYADIESLVAPMVGEIEVYKVHHHGSRYSSNGAWLATTKPKVGIVSVGNANTYGHPTNEALSRLHAAGTRTYWTSVGNGAAPVPGRDIIGGNIVVEVAAAAQTFSVRYGAAIDTFPVHGFSPAPGVPPGPPFGQIDSPGHGATVAGEMPFTGWAIDDSGVTGVEVYRSPLPGEPTQANGLVFLGNATQVQGARTDVHAAYSNYPFADRAGWGYMLLTNMLPARGNGMFMLHAFATSLAGERQFLGSRTIFAANTTSARPFGTIDTPRQGATVSGVVTNFGWALTPQPKMIPLDGSTIDVYIDGVMVGHPSYGHNRPDVAGLFPGYANSDGAVGFFQFDSRLLANGRHSIAWVVRDSSGAAAGMGSRYFFVDNAPAALQLIGEMGRGGRIPHLYAREGRQLRDGGTEVPPYDESAELQSRLAADARAEVPPYANRRRRSQIPDALGWSERQLPPDLVRILWSSS